MNNRNKAIEGVENKYLLLAGHDNDIEEIDSLIDKANGDVESFSALYRERFSTDATIVDVRSSMYKAFSHLCINIAK